MNLVFSRFISRGDVLVSIDAWKIFCNIGASWTAHSLSILLGILSGPDDFDALTFDSNFSSPL
jgi:hypothetical protein